MNKYRPLFAAMNEPSNTALSGRALFSGAPDSARRLRTR